MELFGSASEPVAVLPKAIIGETEWLGEVEGRLKRLDDKPVLIVWPTRDQAFRDLEPQSNYADAADTVVYDAPAWYSGSGSTFENIVGAQVGLVQQGLASPAAALDNARSQLLSYANTPTPL